MLTQLKMSWLNKRCVGSLKDGIGSVRDMVAHEDMLTHLKMWAHLEMSWLIEMFRLEWRCGGLYLLFRNAVAHGKLFSQMEMRRFGFGND